MKVFMNNVPSMLLQENPTLLIDLLEYIKTKEDRVTYQFNYELGKCVVLIYIKKVGNKMIIECEVRR